MKNKKEKIILNGIVIGKCKSLKQSSILILYEDCELNKKAPPIIIEYVPVIKELGEIVNIAVWKDNDIVIYGKVMGYMSFTKYEGNYVPFLIDNETESLI